MTRGNKIQSVVPWLVGTLLVSGAFAFPFVGCATTPEPFGQCLAPRVRRNLQQIDQRIYELSQRGVIRDRNGKVLASSRTAYAVHVVPARLEHGKQVCVTQSVGWQKLTSSLQIKGEQRKELETRINGLCAEITQEKHARKFQAVVVQQDVNPHQIAMLKSQLSELPGVTVVPSSVRYYPYGTLAAHMVGFLSRVGKEQLEHDSALQPAYRQGDLIGTDGIENVEEKELRGHVGQRKITVDEQGHPVPGEQTAIRAPVPGQEVRLTTDIELTKAIAEAMKDHPLGAAVVLDVRNGKVLALYSKPSFDPNVLSGGQGEWAQKKAWIELAQQKVLEPMVDRTMGKLYQPASTFKPLSALAAMRDSLVDPQAKYDCQGVFPLGKLQFRCIRKHGKLNMQQAIAQSCNAYFFNLAEKIGMDRLAKVGSDLGFGRVPGMPLHPELAGRMPTRSWLHTHTQGGYRPGFALNAVIGHGQLQVTVLQQAIAYAALANGGTVFRPQIIDRIGPENNQKNQVFKEVIRHKVSIKEEHLNVIRAGLHAGVSDPKGTAYDERWAAIGMMGKTGTAQSLRPAAVVANDAELSKLLRRNHAWFAAYYPREKPEITVVVMLEHGGGGKKAVQITAKIINAYANGQNK
jgi:penicillin-binding protein 2